MSCQPPTPSRVVGSSEDTDSGELLYRYLLDRAARKAARNAISVGDPSSAATGTGRKQ